MGNWLLNDRCVPKMGFRRCAFLVYNVNQDTLHRLRRPPQGPLEELDLYKGVVADNTIATTPSKTPASPGRRTASPAKRRQLDRQHRAAGGAADRAHAAPLQALQPRADHRQLQRGGPQAREDGGRKSRRILHLQDVTCQFHCLERAVAGTCVQDGCRHSKAVDGEGVVSKNLQTSVVS